MGLFSRKAQARVIAEMASGLDAVRGGVFARLHRSYRATVGDGDAGRMAGAIVNLLFGKAATKPEAAEFCLTHAREIEDGLKSLASEPLEVRDLITQALRVNVTVRLFTDRPNADSAVEALQRALDLGILIPGGDDPTPERFLPLAAEMLRRENAAWKGR